jgi:hypothetical protein
MIDELKKLCRVILQIDLSPIRGRAKYNRLSRAISDVHYFVVTTEMNDNEVKEAQDHLQKVMEQMSSNAYKVQKAIDAVGANC